MKIKVIEEHIKEKKDQIEKIQKEIVDLEKKCRHPKLRGKREGDTGNWDPNDNSYSIDVECPSCGWHDSAYYTCHGSKENEKGRKKFERLENKCKYIWCNYKEKYVLNEL